MEKICKICNKRKTTREGHIDPLCECENDNIVKYYKNSEVQELMNASLGDPNLTKQKRGQMETQVIPPEWWEILPKEKSEFCWNSLGRYLDIKTANENLKEYYEKRKYRIVKVKAV